MQQGTLSASPAKPQPLNSSGLSFPSSPFSATTPVQTAILPVTVPISPTKPPPSGTLTHLTTPKTYPPPVTNTTTPSSNLKTPPFNGVKVPTTSAVSPHVTPTQPAVPRTQYPTPFTTPVKVPPNLVKTPQTTPLSPAKPHLVGSPAKPALTNIRANVSSPVRSSPILSTTATLPPHTYTTPTLSTTNSPQIQGTHTPYTPLRTSYSALAPPSPALSINTSPLAKSVPPLSSPDPAKKTHIVSGFLSDLRKQTKV